MIDAHQHFWKLDRGDYAWLNAEPEILQRDYLPADLMQHLGDTGVRQTILVQAAETQEETSYILSLAEVTDCIAGVVGWIDFDAPDVMDHLTMRMRQPNFLGVRPVLQGIEDTDWILAEHRIEVLAQIALHGKTFDALIQPRHLPVIARLTERLPDLKIVVDHGAKPDIANQKIDDWKHDIALLAQKRQVCCKLSGLVTEARENWTRDELEPFMRHLLRCFGPDRLMWGSDWPVVNAASSYQQWHEIALDVCRSEMPMAVDAIFGGNAQRFYNVGAV
ncbi:MAG TPA: amidohydrolase [Thalassospira sp.]|nr:amidohydrolase [Thalassospira sp.]